MLVVIGIDCLGSCKSNYHMITKMTAPCSISRQSILSVEVLNYLRVESGDLIG